MTEEQLLLGLNQKETAAIGALFNLHYNGLCYFATDIIKDKGQAKEIASDAFTKLWVKDCHFTSLKQAKQYIYTITRNACIDYLRMKKSQIKNQIQIGLLAETQDSSIEEKISKSEVLEQIKSEIEKLPRRQREVFKLSYFEDLSTAEIASKLKIKDKTAINTLKNAEDALKKTLKAKGLAWIFLMVSFSSN